MIAPRQRRIAYADRDQIATGMGVLGIAECVTS